MLSWHGIFGESGGLSGVTKKPKISKIKGCATTFLGLGGFVVVLWWGCGMIGGSRLIICDW